MENSANNFGAISASVSVIGAIITLIGAIITLYKIKPETKKIESDGLSSISNAASSLANGAKVNSEQLLARIEEMEEREETRETELFKIREDLKSVIADLLEWKDYAFRLSHQIKSLGHTPVPFKAEKK